MQLSSRSLKQVILFSIIFFSFLVVIYWAVVNKNNISGDDIQQPIETLRPVADQDDVNVSLAIKNQYRGITKQEFLQASQLARDLEKKCRSNIGQPGCITEACPTFPFGFDARPKGHTEELVGNNCEPWMRRDVILLLNQLVKPYFTVLEWSSGSSTIWTLPRVARLISVEDNAEWASSVIKKVESMGLSHKSEFHIIPGTNEGPEWAKSSTGKFFVDYVGVKLPKELHAKYDMIIVDGRARPACLHRAVSLLKPEGGILVLDNSERNYKRDYVPAYWPRFTSIDARPTETTVWLSQLPSQ